MESTRIENLSDISNDYDAFLIDAWGVLHDGGTVFPDALVCLKSLIKDSKKVVILSNAARRTVEFNNELLKAGINTDCYHFSLSSGELVRQNFKQKKYKHSGKELGKRCYYLGPERSIGILNDLELERVSSINNADFILNTGADGNQPDAIKYEPLLSIALTKMLPMICANPDLVAIRKGVRGISAGTIAKLYEAIGGDVVYTGKPYTQIYQVCHEKLGLTAKNRILMIGDGLQTDIKGANDFGIDSLFIKNGIYRQQIDTQSNHQSTNETSTLNKLFAEEGAQPSYYLDRLKYR